MSNQRNNTNKTSQRRTAQQVRKRAYPPPNHLRQRRYWVMVGFISVVMILLWQAVRLQIMHKEFLQSEGDARYVRTHTIPAYRGMLLDRHNQPLAVSTPVDSVWVNPQPFQQAQTEWQHLAALLNYSRPQLEARLQGRLNRQFVYLKRHIPPTTAAKIKALALPGVHLQREYRRYYPTAAMTTHVMGFTDIDDKGLEGLELAFDKFLVGNAGAKQVIQDQHGQVIADIGVSALPRPGQDIRLSLDRRLQYIVYRELQQAVHTHQAHSASAVLMDVHSGEVLAMVNYPAYNPNNRAERRGKFARNRSITDVFEPGSTVKPFTLAAALESGHYQTNTLINTAPGSLTIGQYTVHDARNYGTIDLTKILQKSSNVGASHISLALPRQQLWQMAQHIGFGQMSGSGFPGEATGYVPHFREWNKVKQATLSFGYGLNVTLLQLARAYATLGNEGVLPPVRFTPYTAEQALSTYLPQPAMQADTARHLLRMLEGVVKPDGTGKRAQVAGYRIAGKTGTVKKTAAGGYSESDYLALFVGLAPASQPQVVLAVLIDEPRVGGYYGGEVAAPVFARVMASALRLLNIAPDAL